MNSQEMVRVLDLETQQIVTIPACELAYGMIQADLIHEDGSTEKVWIRTPDFPLPDIRHPLFPEAVKDLIRKLHATFGDVDGRSLELWEDLLRRDANPDKDIALWLLIADAFKHFSSGRTLPFNRRKEIYGVIVVALNNGENTRYTVPRLTLSRRRVREIVDYVLHLRRNFHKYRDQARRALGWIAFQPGEVAGCLLPWVRNADGILMPVVDGIAQPGLVPIQKLLGTGPEPYLEDEAYQTIVKADVVMGMPQAKGGGFFVLGEEAWDRAEVSNPPHPIQVLAVSVADEGEAMRRLQEMVQNVKNGEKRPSAN
jgi:hypothetical protein